MTSDESPVNYNKEHFPEGLNKNFSGAKEELKAKFAGSSGIFESESRELFAQRHAIASLVASLAAKRSEEEANRPGKVLELGFGTGCFTELFCRQGLYVLGTETSAGFVEMLDEKIREAATLSAGDADPEHWALRCGVSLASDHSLGSSHPWIAQDASFDVAFICDVYHHLLYPHSTMQDVHRLLKPNGRVVLIDFHRDSAKHHSHPAGWVEAHVRGGFDVFSSELREVGFVLEEADVKVEGVTENYIAVFRKTS